MSLDVDYSYPYRATLKRFHWRVASDVDAAVLRFAAHAERLRSGRYAVRAGGEARGYEIAVLVDRGRGAILAESIYRARV